MRRDRDPRKRKVDEELNRLMELYKGSEENNRIIDEELKKQAATLLLNKNNQVSYIKICLKQLYNKLKKQYPPQPTTILPVNQDLINKCKLYIAGLAYSSSNDKSQAAERYLTQQLINYVVGAHYEITQGSCEAYLDERSKAWWKKKRSAPLTDSINSDGTMLTFHTPKRQNKKRQPVSGQLEPDAGTVTCACNII